MNRVAMKIMRGKVVLFRAEIIPQPIAYEGKFNGEEKFLEDVFNIERYINEQGAYRCHVEDIES